MKSKFLLCAMLVFSAFALTACDSSEPTDETTNTGTVACTGGDTCAIENAETAVTQLANPASEKCIADGGKLLPQKAEDGSEYALCQFANGSICEEWAYFRGECAPTAD